MDIIKKKLNTKHIKPEEIVFIPVIKDFGKRNYYSLIKYMEITSKDISIPEMNRLILEEFASVKPKYYNNPDSFNFDYYIVPGKSNIVVIDFDEIDRTLKKLDFLCSNNEEFQLNWLRFKNEYLENTFKVKSPTGGYHYYFRHKLDLSNRSVKVLKPDRFLSGSVLEEYSKLFALKKTKSDKESYDPIGIDILSNGVVCGAGNIFKNMIKKGELWPKREYKILKDIELKTLDESAFPLIREIFDIESDSEKDKEQKKSNKRVQVKPKGNGPIGFSEYDYTDLIRIEREIESLDLKTKDDVLCEYSEDFLAIKESHRRLIKERNDLLDYSLNENTIEFYEEETRLSVQIKEELNKFKNKKKEIIKDLFSKKPDTEYIFNSLRRFEIEEEYAQREQIIYPSLLSNLDTVEKGKRSELEMAFVVNLKVRNYEDPVIFYLVQRDFLKSLKSFENPGFLEYATQKAETFKKYPEQLNFKGVWNEIILAYSLSRKINYEGIFSHSGAKIRTLVETLYDICSIQNTFTIRNKSQTHFSLGGMASISNKTIPKYLQILEDEKFFKEIVWEKGAKGRKLYPKRITLKNAQELMALSWVKKNLLSEARYTPQDANQSFASIKGVGPRGLEIIGYIRDNGGTMHRSDIYKKFENINDHRRVIGKVLRKLKELEILTMGDDKSYRLNSISLNKAYETYALEYNKKIKEMEKSKSEGRKSKIREKKLDVIESRKDNCIKEKYYMKNLISSSKTGKQRKKTN